MDNSTGKLSVIAVEEEPTNDLVQYGIVKKPAEVFSHLESVRQKLQQDPNVEPRIINKAVVSIGGHTLMSTVKSAEQNFPEDIVITDTMIRDLKAKIANEGIADREVVKVLPRDFLVNGDVQQHPVGMFCHSIGGNFNVVYCSKQLKIGLNRVFESQTSGKNAIVVEKYPVRPLAIANLVLTNEDMQLGCMLVDFGAETTTVSIYKKGTLRYLVTLPFGSRNITRDIMNLCSCIEDKAEEMKKNIGNITPESQKQADTDTTKINNYIYARASEIIANITEQLKYAGIKPEELAQGLVITGGGAKLRGFNSLLSKQSGLKIRVATPINANIVYDGLILPADHVDVIALLAHAANLRNKEDMLSSPVVKEETQDQDVSRIGEEEKVDLDDEEPENNTKGKSKSRSMLDRIKDLLSDNDVEE